MPGVQTRPPWPPGPALAGEGGACALRVGGGWVGSQSSAGAAGGPQATSARNSHPFIKAPPGVTRPAVLTPGPDRGATPRARHPGLGRPALPPEATPYSEEGRLLGSPREERGAGAPGARLPEPDPVPVSHPGRARSDCRSRSWEGRPSLWTRIPGTLGLLRPASAFRSFWGMETRPTGRCAGSERPRAPGRARSTEGPGRMGARAPGAATPGQELRCRLLLPASRSSL